MSQLNELYQFYDPEHDLLINGVGDISRTLIVEYPNVFDSQEEFITNHNKAITEKITSFKSFNKYDLAITQSASYFFSKEHFDTPLHYDFLERKAVEFHNRIKTENTQIYFTLTIKRGIEKIKHFLPFFKRETTPSNFYNSELLDCFNSNFDHLFQLFKETKDIRASNITGNNHVRNLLLNHWNLNNFHPTKSTVLSPLVTDHHNHCIASGDTLVKIYTVANGGIQVFPAEISESHKYPNLYRSHWSDICFGYGIPCIATSHLFIPANKERYDSKLYRRLKTYNMLTSSDNQHTVLDFNEMHRLDLYPIHQSFTLIGNNKETKTFLEACNDFEYRVKKDHDLILSRNHQRQKDTFIANTFGNAFFVDDLDKNVAPATFIPNLFVKESLKGKPGDGIRFRDRYSRNVIGIDFLKLNTTNKNGYIAGATGTGKSATINQLIRYFRSKRINAKVIHQDVGYSQYNLCKELNGIYVEITQNNPIKLNPFSVFLNSKGKYDIHKSDDDSDDMLFIKNVLFNCFRNDADTYSNVEGQIIARTVILYLKECNKQKKLAWFNGYYLFVKDYFKSIEDNEKTSQFPYNSYIITLEAYLSEDPENNLDAGEFHYVFSKTDENDKLKEILENPFVVFEFEKIRDNRTIMNITSFLLSSIIDKSLYNKTQMYSATVSIMDEMHVFMKTEKDFKKIDYNYRVFRKHDGSVWSASQRLQDVTKFDTAGEVIVESSAFKIIKKQDKKHRNEVQKMLNISESQTNMLFSIPEEDKQISHFIQIGQTAMIGDLLIEKYNLQIAKTEKKHRLYMKDQLDQGKSATIAAINRIEQTEKDHE